MLYVSVKLTDHARTTDITHETKTLQLIRTRTYSYVLLRTYVPSRSVRKTLAITKLDRYLTSKIARGGYGYSIDYRYIYTVKE